LILAWALQQCSATALPVIVTTSLSCTVSEILTVYRTCLANSFSHKSIRHLPRKCFTTECIDQGVKQELEKPGQVSEPWIKYGNQRSSEEQQK